MVTRARLLRSATRRRGVPACRRSGDAVAGYNLVILMVMVTVMNVLVAVALPSWSTAIQRQKEKELIFRGLQYAEAIRVFQLRTGRYPVSLRELLENEPRAIRQLWTDPFRALVSTRGTIPGVEAARKRASL